MLSTHQQTIVTLRGNRVERLHLPSADTEIVFGVRWGKFEDFFTPAFWKSRSWIDGENSQLENYLIGHDLREEVAACLLGGYGMPAEVGLAAFHRLRNGDLLNGNSSQEQIENALAQPLSVNGRMLKYRYPRVKARFLSAAMARLNVETPPLYSGVELRNWLMTFSGIGPKTASWITRNFLHSDDVAILDVHIVRAGLLMGLFSPNHSIEKDYFQMEERLVTFSRSINVKLSKFDSMIWCYMRRLNALALDTLAVLNLQSNPA